MPTNKLKNFSLKKIHKIVLVIGLILFTTSFYFFKDSAKSVDTSTGATVVTGQSSMSTNIVNAPSGTPSASSLSTPTGVHYDGTKLYVADSLNNRVLIYNSNPSSHGSSASVVLGQADFSSVSANRGGAVADNTLYNPKGVIVAGSKLLVVDSSNNRVLIWNTIPTSNGQAADVVIGQVDMTTNVSATSQTGLASPNGVMYESSSGKLFITDYNNNRVLIYNSIPTSNTASANSVIGQASFISNSSGTTSTTLKFPTNTRFINSKLFIADSENNRVLIYNAIPTTDGVAADLVLGQADFTSGSQNRGGSASLTTLKTPKDMLYDGTTLYVLDSGNSRMLGWTSFPTSSGVTAQSAYSTSNTDSNTPSAKSLSSPSFLTYNGSAGKLIVSDSGNNRVLFYGDGPASSSSQSEDLEGFEMTFNTVKFIEAKEGEVAHLGKDTKTSADDLVVKWTKPTDTTVVEQYDLYYRKQGKKKWKFKKAKSSATEIEFSPGDGKFEWFLNVRLTDGSRLSSRKYRLEVDSEVPTYKLLEVSGVEITSETTEFGVAFGTPLTITTRETDSEIVVEIWNVDKTKQFTNMVCGSGFCSKGHKIVGNLTLVVYAQNNVGIETEKKEYKVSIF